LCNQSDCKARHRRVVTVTRFLFLVGLLGDSGGITHRRDMPVVVEGSSCAFGRPDLGHGGGSGRGVGVRRRSRRANAIVQRVVQCSHGSVVDGEVAIVIDRGRFRKCGDGVRLKSGAHKEQKKQNDETEEKVYLFQTTTSFRKK